MENNNRRHRVYIAQGFAREKKFLLVRPTTGIIEKDVALLCPSGSGLEFEKVFYNQLEEELDNLETQGFEVLSHDHESMSTLNPKYSIFVRKKANAAPT